MQGKFDFDVINEDIENQLNKTGMDDLKQDSQEKIVKTLNAVEFFNRLGDIETYIYNANSAIHEMYNIEQGENYICVHFGGCESGLDLVVELVAASVIKVYYVVFDYVNRMQDLSYIKYDNTRGLKSDEDNYFWRNDVTPELGVRYTLDREYNIKPDVYWGSKFTMFDIVKFEEFALSFYGLRQDKFANADFFRQYGKKFKSLVRKNHWSKKYLEDVPMDVFEDIDYQLQKEMYNVYFPLVERIHEETKRVYEKEKGYLDTNLFESYNLKPVLNKKKE